MHIGSKIMAAAVCPLLAASLACADKHTNMTYAGAANRSVVEGDATGPGVLGEQHLAREVRHELVMLPYYGVFDDLKFRVTGSTVTLMGFVTRPTLKSDAANVVKNIEGVTAVNNEIQVLPLSSFDDRIRIATYRTVYGQPPLDRYALQAVPPIHIIVNNGHVTLDGAVASEADKQMAGIRANGVPGVFSVQNDLRVAP